MLRLVKIAATVIAAFVAIKLALEVLSFLTSFWFILAAVGLWLFIRKSKNARAAG